MVSWELAWTINGISINVLKVRDRMEWWGRLAKIWEPWKKNKAVRMWGSAQKKDKLIAKLSGPQP